MGITENGSATSRELGRRCCALSRKGERARKVHVALWRILAKRSHFGKNQPAAVGNERRPHSLVSGLLFTMNGAPPTWRAVGARRRHPRQEALSARGAP